MHKLFLFLFKRRTFILFVVLELVCFFLIVKHNRFQSASFFNSSNAVIGGMLQQKSSIYDYFSLKRVNNELAFENAKLRARLYSLEGKNLVLPDSLGDSLRLKLFNEKLNVDSLGENHFKGDYEFLPAKVINNSVKFANNYITLDRGRLGGVENGMGVISDQGVVGIVKSVSNNFSTVASLLHTNILISSEIKSVGVIGSVRWDGEEPRVVMLDYIPRHIDVHKGDTVVTSGYNAIFPQGIMVGTIDEVDLPQNQSFYDISVKLSNDFTALKHVYLVENKNKLEIDSLQNQTDLKK
ncbi:rod shape-determining protein MreC [Aureibacter tunicatorum]|uniref:Cell shape-determining protein MreC n=1 Tax=Aureibacter tunicatorum TaxID=866807 RepID=A0AAE3XMA5_9BACT|nr:rod shape-determining protein MreC [Aureibacter tunicatorum]MDR6238396.1 rod shape-determining protein MreC [Aureibacter tunicatorum]BDD03428.1 rod shape-determining protein MreC [Aureibacter tunicatorum]